MGLSAGQTQIELDFESKVTHTVDIGVKDDEMMLRLKGERQRGSSDALAIASFLLLLLLLLSLCYETRSEIYEKLR